MLEWRAYLPESFKVCSFLICNREFVIACWTPWHISRSTSKYDCRREQAVAAAWSIYRSALNWPCSADESRSPCNWANLGSPSRHGSNLPDLTATLFASSTRTTPKSSFCTDACASARSGNKLRCLTTAFNPRRETLKRPRVNGCDQAVQTTFFQKCREVPRKLDKTSITPEKRIALRSRLLITSTLGLKDLLERYQDVACHLHAHLPRRVWALSLHRMWQNAPWDDLKSNTKYQCTRRYDASVGVPLRFSTTELGKLWIDSGSIV